jgi:hypothetical protein
MAYSHHCHRYHTLVIEADLPPGTRYILIKEVAWFTPTTSMSSYFYRYNGTGLVRVGTLKLAVSKGNFVSEQKMHFHDHNLSRIFQKLDVFVSLFREIIDIFVKNFHFTTKFVSTFGLVPP